MIVGAIKTRYGVDEETEEWQQIYRDEPDSLVSSLDVLVSRYEARQVAEREARERDYEALERKIKKARAFRYDAESPRPQRGSPWDDEYLESPKRPYFAPLVVHRSDFPLPHQNLFATDTILLRPIRLLRQMIMRLKFLGYVQQPNGEAWLGKRVVRLFKNPKHAQHVVLWAARRR